MLSEVRRWDEVTAGVVLARLAPATELSFFTVAEVAVARPLLDLLLAQDAEPRIPVLAMVDARLAMGETDGWHYDDMPEDGQAWRRTLTQLDQDAQDRHGARFAALPANVQAALVQSVQTIGEAGGRWHGLPAQQVWSLWTRYACTAFYSHPWAWNEIGFGGPAYPRGYKNFGLDSRGTMGESRPRRHRPDPVRPSGRAGPRRSCPPPRSDPGDPVSSADLVRERNASAWLIPNDGSRTNHALRADMRRYDPPGRGGPGDRRCWCRWQRPRPAAGPSRLAHRRSWTQGRSGTPTRTGSATSAARTPCTGPSLARSAAPTRSRSGSNNSGRGVGGSMIHYAGYTPRFHPSDFRTHTQDGVGADWPITYQDLKPHYEAIEAELPVAGQDWPWGDPHRYPQHAHPVGGNGDIFLRGASALGIEARVGPVAISNGRFGNRPHCIYRGFCLQGCKVNAKASPLITHIPDAFAHGAEIRPDSHVTRVAGRRRHRPRHRSHLPA